MQSSPILVTGFEPFGGESLNPSLLVLEQLPDSLLGVPLKKLQVPTAFEKAAAVALAAMEEHQPQAVLLLGQAGGRSGITVERVAINVDDARIPDNLSAQPVDMPIAADGPAAYFSTLPIKAMVQAIKEAGLEASVSDTAGTYVCNHLLYAVLHHISQHKLPCKACFVHLPYLPEQAEGKTPPVPFMALPRQVKGIQAALQATLDSSFQGKALSFRA